MPERLANEPPRTEAERRAELERLHRLVRLADQPMATITHDRALGDIAVRGEPLNEPLIEACALTVLRGRSANVYLPCNSEMIVGLTPIEAARALYLQWLQSGQSPKLPHYEGWLFADDGYIAVPDCWGEDALYAIELVEPIDEQIRRQRAAAGLA
jgi:hypothetical protein